MSIARRIAKNTLSLTAGELVSKAFLFFLTVLIARYLGSSELGKYSFAFSFTVLFYVLADLGLNKLALRNLPRDKSQLGNYLYNILAMKVVLSIITFLAIFFSINLTNQPQEVKVLVYLAGLYMIISESIATLFRNVFVSFERASFEAFVTIIEKFIILILGYLALVKSYGLFWLFIAFLTGGIIRALLGIIIIFLKFRPKFRIIPKSFLPLIKKAFPFCLTYLLATIYIKIDITMLSLMQGDAAVGFYTAAANIIFALVIIPAVFMRAVFPNMSRFYVTDKISFVKSCKLSLKYLIIVGLPIIFGGIALAKPIIILVYTERFLSSVVAFQILLIFLFLYFMKWALNIALYAANLEKQVALSYLFGLIVNIGLNFILIPKYSYVGAGITTIITEILVVVLIYYWFIKRISKLPIKKYFIKPMTSAMIMGYMVYNLQTYSLFLIVPLGAICYVIILLVTKGLNDRDIRLIKEALKIQ